ncbi:MAG: hypothetical protein QJR12_16855 [Mycobacterium sp.]|uniref:hypothetical protein n=1 Tax=Mycobacterium sp. TaxID=1785 RepID=UPI0026330DA1|nr:hypothetical protein [Mycobacterium sp.]MDI3315877.1 hypothetical protein [Mycobacterium sp.]
MTAPARGGSVQEVRAAVSSFLADGSIPYLSHVYKAPPFDMGTIPWDTLIQPGETATCFAVLWIDRESDLQPIAMDGKGGRRICRYDATLGLFFFDTSGDAETAQDKLDQVIDGVKQRLRSDPALGTDPETSNIIAAATEQLDINRGRPERQGGGDTFGALTEVLFNVDSYEWSS